MVSTLKDIQQQNTMITPWYFDDVDLFQLLWPDKFKNYKKERSFSIYKNKDYIYFEADAANKIYLIKHGKVEIRYY